MLTPEQIEFFDKNGYLHLPAVLSPVELTGLQNAADSLMASIPKLPPQWQNDFKYGALVGDQIGEGNILCRMEYSLQKDPRFLALLGNPNILALAGILHRDSALLTWEDMIIKMPGSGFPVPFHQDKLYQSLRSRVFSIGIYLDDSPNDPLQIIPGTQRLGPLTQQDIESIVTTRQNEIVEVPAKAGDFIVHNVLAIHGSRDNRGHLLRRVIYFEFRTISQVLNDSPWDKSWMEKRLKLVPEAIRLRKELGMVASDSALAWSEAKKLSHYWSPPCGYFDNPGNVELRVPHD